jgi:hypothetical protein
MSASRNLLRSIYRLFFGKYWVDGAGEDAKTPLAKEKQKQKLTGIRNKNNKKRR